MIHTYALAFMSSFVFIFLKAFQQLSVVHHRVWLIVPTSMAMALTEVYVVVSAAHNGWGWIVLPIGLGSGLGCLSSMYVSAWERNRSKK